MTRFAVVVFYAEAKTLVPYTVETEFDLIALADSEKETGNRIANYIGCPFNPQVGDLIHIFEPTVKKLKSLSLGEFEKVSPKARKSAVKTRQK